MARKAPAFRKRCGKDRPGKVGQRAPAPDVHPLERSREVWAAWRAPFFLIQKESVVASNEVLPNPFVSAETLKACALIG